MSKRLTFVFLSLIFSMILIIARLFYWQVVASEKLAKAGESQHYETIELPAMRGEIRSSDNFPLAANRRTFLIYAYLPLLEESPEGIADKLAPILSPLFHENEATVSATGSPQNSESSAREILLEKLTREDILWIPLVRNASEDQREALEQLDLKGIGTELSYGREYPEATMAASLLGFVGSDTAGNPKGYFGIEGFYDLELKGRPGILRHEKDASGKPILIGSYDKLEAKDGRNVTLHLDRAVQRIVEDKLEEGIRKYQATSGEVVVLHPSTGALVAMSALPSYDPSNFRLHEQSFYKNPIVSETYEPGSTFKVFIMSAAIDAKAVTPETKCTQCDGPVRIGGYTIRTWNNEYHDEPSMREIIQYSDNVGMVFTAGELGLDKLYDYLTRFGMGKETDIDLEEEASSFLRPKDDWKEIDLATVSFGQGIAVTGIQMVRAVAAIANRGIMMTPRVVAKVEGEKIIEIKPKVIERVISEVTAEIVTEMMVNAVENGEAQWAKPEGISIAGKTGTSQIPVAGHYDEEKTIASFVGFAPANHPKFVMLVKLREPQTSPWGSETAAPLWFSIAEELYYYYSIPRESEK